MKRPMMTRILALAAAAAITTPIAWDYFAPSSEPSTGHGDPATLLNAYQDWQSGYDARNGARELTLGLSYAKGLSRERTGGNGQLKLDLETGNLTAEIRGLPAHENLALWLIDRGDSAGSASADRTVRIGDFTRTGDTLTLHARLDRQGLWGFKLDMAAVAPTDASPMEKGLLFGSPGLFQRLYYGERPWTIARIGSLQDNAKEAGAPAFAFLLPKPAVADDRRLTPGNLPQVATDLVSEGKRLFTKETFGGNGRTCESCHRLDNNHTIDPKYIATLPKNDPLFVAEYDPALNELENPTLMRQFGLILANADGFDKPPVFRSVPHTLALSQTIKLEFPCTSAQEPGCHPKAEFGQDLDYWVASNGEAEAVGWSQDGAPVAEGGSLRAFTIGAVIQHFPRTLNRVPGSDFDLPTDYELDAIEAYMRSLGRSKDIVLGETGVDKVVEDGTGLQFSNPLVQRGKRLFNTKQNPVVNGAPVFGQTANCNGCHSNGGAISSTTGGNPTRDTGIENMRDQPARLVVADVAFDGGFGTGEADCGPTHDQPCFGDARFNTTSLIEAADTPPFFHNNSVNTIEEAVAFYNTDEFNKSPGARTSSGASREVKLSSSQVVAVASFLRSVNAMENIRSSNSLAHKALSQRGDEGRSLSKEAAADTEDAIEVLSESQMNLFPDALKKLQQALLLEKGAALSPAAALRNSLLSKAIKLKIDACNAIASEQDPFFCRAPSSTSAL
jgi:hypothetical protein